MSSNSENETIIFDGKEIDGSIVRLVSIKGINQSKYRCPEQGDGGYDEILIETDKGIFVVGGCGSCWMVYCAED